MLVDDVDVVVSCDVAVVGITATAVVDGVVLTDAIVVGIESISCFCC